MEVMVRALRARELGKVRAEFSKHADFEKFDIWLKKYAGLPNVRLLIAKAARKPIGLASMSTKGSVAKFDHLFVHPDFRKKGVGSKLVLARMHEVWKDPKIKSIELYVKNNPVALDKYAGFGFELDENYGYGSWLVYRK